MPHGQSVFAAVSGGPETDSLCCQTLHLGKGWEMCAHSCWHPHLRNNTEVDEEGKDQGGSFSPEGCRNRSCSALPRSWQLLDSRSWCDKGLPLVQEVVLGVLCWEAETEEEKDVQHCCQHCLCRGGGIRLQSHHPAKNIKLTEIKSHKERKQASCQK